MFGWFKRKREEQVRRVGIDRVRETVIEQQAQDRKNTYIAKYDASADQKRHISSQATENERRRATDSSFTNSLLAAVVVEELISSSSSHTQPYEPSITYDPSPSYDPGPTVDYSSDFSSGSSGGAGGGSDW